MVPATTRRHRHPRCPEASQAPQAPEARVVSTWLLASARFQGINVPSTCAHCFSSVGTRCSITWGTLARRGGQYSARASGKLRPSSMLKCLREGCTFAKGLLYGYSPQRCIPPACLAGSSSRRYRCPSFRQCCSHSHRRSNHPSMLINQTHHYHNYSPPNTSPHYNMR